MGKLRSYIEYTLSIVRCLKPFQILLFLLLFLFFLCVLRNTLLSTCSFLFLVCHSERSYEARMALAGQSRWGFCLSVILCVVQTNESHSNKNFTVQQTPMWLMYATWCILFVTGHSWKLFSFILPPSPIV